nr:hypothetical protein [Tanacetum cinerariifolium]
MIQKEYKKISIKTINEYEEFSTEINHHVNMKGSCEYKPSYCRSIQKRKMETTPSETRNNTICNWSKSCKQAEGVEGIGKWRVWKGSKEYFDNFWYDARGKMIWSMQSNQVTFFALFFLTVYITLDVLWLPTIWCETYGSHICFTLWYIEPFFEA